MFSLPRAAININDGAMGGQRESQRPALRRCVSCSRYYSPLLRRAAPPHLLVLTSQQSVPDGCKSAPQ